jgi:hypothetical protein
MAAFTFIEPEEEAEEEAPPLPENEPELIENTDTGEAAPAATGFMPGPQRRPSLTARWGKPKLAEFPEDSLEDGLEPGRENTVTPQPASTSEPEPPKLKLGIKSSGPQSELSLDSAPRGRFEGETPNVFDGEDLDLPPFLRKKK